MFPIPPSTTHITSPLSSAASLRIVPLTWSLRHCYRSVVHPGRVLAGRFVVAGRRRATATAQRRGAAGSAAPPRLCVPPLCRRGRPTARYSHRPATWRCWQSRPALLLPAYWRLRSSCLGSCRLRKQGAWPDMRSWSCGRLGSKLKARNVFRPPYICLPVHVQLYHTRTHVTARCNLWL